MKRKPRKSGVVATKAEDTSGNWVVKWEPEVQPPKRAKPIIPKGSLGLWKETEVESILHTVCFLSDLQHVLKDVLEWYSTTAMDEPDSIVKLRLLVWCADWDKLTEIAARYRGEKLLQVGKKNARKKVSGE